MAGISLNSNISSLTTQRRLALSSSQLTESYERLSSGLRLSRAADDAAGLAVSSLLNVDARVFSQGLRNLSDAVSVGNIAEGALDEMRAITLRKMELAEQAANGTLSKPQRIALTKEANALVEEFNRIVATVNFNGTALLAVSPSGAVGSQIQAGYGEGGGIEILLGSGLQHTVGTGTFSTTELSRTILGPVQGVADLNNDSIPDIFSTAYVALGNGDASFKAPIAFDSQLFEEFMTGDVNGDGTLDLVGAVLYMDTYSYIHTYMGVLIGNGDGSFKAAISRELGDPSEPFVIGHYALGDVTGDGRDDIVVSDSNNNSVSIMAGGADGTPGPEMEIPSGQAISDLAVADINGDGRNDLVLQGLYGSLYTRLGNGNGTFEAATSYAGGENSFSMQVADFNLDGNLDVAALSSSGDGLNVRLGIGGGVLGSLQTLAANGYRLLDADLNGDGFQDLIARDSLSVRAFLANGDGTFRAMATFATSAQAAAIGDLNGDGVSDLITSNFKILFGQTEFAGTVQHLDLSTAAGARAALPVLRQELSRVSTEIGNIGAVQSRLTSAISNLQVSRENYEFAASQITDVDTADESAALLKTQILQQAASSVLAQANQSPALALKLLSGG